MPSMAPTSSAYIVEPARSFIEIILNFGTDFFAFLVIAGIIAVFAFYFGGDRLVPLIAGVYAAIPLYIHFPFFSTFPDTAYVHIGVYVAFAVLSLIAFSGLSYFTPTTSVGFLNVAIISALTAGLMIAIGIHLLPVEEVYAFSEPTKALFTFPNAFFWWLVGPLVGLFFFGKG